MDLRTTYMGMRLKNPLVVGASPLSRDVGVLQELEDAGAAAVVMFSLFQEQIEHELDEHLHFEQYGTESFHEALHYVPRLNFLPKGPDEYVEHVAQVKRALGIPVIASLNGTSVGGWIEYAHMLEQAGADGLELNIYHVATDPAQSALDVEEQYLHVVRVVKESVNIPVALKIGPYFSSLPNFAKRLDEHGVDGLVLFNRFYQPDIDLDMLEVVPDIVLSASHEMRLPLRWIAILDPFVVASLAASTGIYTCRDVIKLLMAGADATMLVAALLRRGPQAIGDILNGMTQWLEEHEYVSVHQLQGSMNHRACRDPSAFERSNYMRAIRTFL